MIRHLLAGAAALSLMSGAAFAQSGYSETTTTVTHPAVTQPMTTTTVTQPDVAVPAGSNRGDHVVAGGVGGAAVGAAIGCIATIPIGCAPGAAFGAAVGGGSGAVIGAAAPAPEHYDYVPAQR